MALPQKKYRFFLRFFSEVDYHGPVLLKRERRSSETTRGGLQPTKARIAFFFSRWTAALLLLREAKHTSVVN